MSSILVHELPITHLTDIQDLNTEELNMIYGGKKGDVTITTTKNKNGDTIVTIKIEG
jgi:hypothetical protein